MVRSKIAKRLVRSGMEGEVREAFSCRGEDSPDFEETSHQWIDPPASKGAERLKCSRSIESDWAVSGSSESEFLGCLRRAPEVRSHQVPEKNKSINIF